MPYRVLLLAALITTVPSGADAAQSTPAATAYHAIVAQAGRRHGVDAALIEAVIRAESNFDPRAISPAGAIGLMQLLPATAASYGVTDRASLFDPAINVDTGTRHLKRLLNKYRNINRALMAYNAGEYNEARFRRSGVFLETRKYAVRVIRYYQQLKKR